MTLTAHDCSFDLHPRLAADTAAVATLDLCELRLMDDARYPWLILVPRRAGARGLLDLVEADRALLLVEISRCAQMLQDLHTPTRINIALLGNQVSQLHAHVIARFEGDAAWPRPVWGVGTAEPYLPDARAARVAAYRQHLGV
ncbi:MAG: HIT domain-containing protein [Proteobacteria bacterium]|nr:HIT domain-containing protein [Pseudomonadota bacterium]